MRIEHVVFAQYLTMPARHADAVYVMKMCQAFQQEGFQTTLYAPLQRGESADPGAMWDFYGIRTQFKVVLPPPLPGLRTYDVALRTALYARRMKHTVVFAHNNLAAAFSSLFGVATIPDIHDKPPGRMGALHLRWALRGSGFCRLAVLTQTLKDLYLQLYPSLHPDQIVIAPDAVDLEQFIGLPDRQIAREELDLPTDRFIAGYAGHLYEGRGMDVILEVARRLPEVFFLIVGGEAEDIAYWQDQIRQGELANIMLAGYVSNTILPRYMAAADALLLRGLRLSRAGEHGLRHARRVRRRGLPAGAGRRRRESGRSAPAPDLGGADPDDARRRSPTRSGARTWAHSRQRVHLGAGERGHSRCVRRTAVQISTAI